jgi:Predicted Fe-S-cluster oxidoreductase
MIPEYERILERSRTKQKETMRQMRHLSKFSTNGFDRTVHGIHDEVFAEIDCQQCGNCCRSLGPRFRDTDIKLICKSTGTDPKQFTEDCLKPDDEGAGFVLKALPCPFQNADNSCSDYEHRTLSCRDFPHTRSRNVQKKLVGLALDSLVCPAAFLIIERMLKER